MRRVAFLGLGNMGIGMARRLLAAGHGVAVYNRSPGRAAPLVQQGATAAATPREAAAGAEIVFSMVGDDAASRHMWLGRDGALAARTAPRAFAVECSTISHRWIAALAARARGQGLRFVDCPVTGLPDAAAAGRLTLFLGADKADADALAPVFAAIATEVIHFGPVGAGNAYKLIVNLMGSIQIAALAEGLVTAERAGLDLGQVVQALSKGGSASPQVVRNAPLMLRGRHAEDVVFSGKWRLKDTAYGLAHARAMGVASTMGAGAAAAFRLLVADGTQHQNESKLVDAVRARDSRQR
ncbi:3-hydroxyisobutyrate dehydrogenase [Stella humosa]|uniref:3-hydroxyisobutyrate dehydrogenase n=1 Tax=Stella humosa TaxID=94 RepID=A0A3N1KSK1_9PROT|nr:NAD(P)-dependent oxidoreductase [Stella humosa]ROP81370.1 3-hydroxyisobutyrate dehydrogenase [Stella humosa]BBK32721.1 oxidoreductase [Stella humosa]